MIPDFWKIAEESVHDVIYTWARLPVKSDKILAITDKLVLEIALILRKSWNSAVEESAKVAENKMEAGKNNFVAQAIRHCSKCDDGL